MDAGKFSLVALFFVIVLVGVGYGQAPDTLWTRTYEIRADEGAFNIQDFSVWQTLDGGFVVAGDSFSTSSSSDIDFFLMKVDSMGEYLWGHRYSHGAAAYRVLHGAYSVQQTTDSGFIVIGTRSVGINPYETLFYTFMVKTNSSGGCQWQRSPGPGQMSFCGQQTSDGGYICAGKTEPTSIYSDFLLSKRDSQGFGEWSHTYGGSNFDDAFSVQENIDGGYILAGRTASFGAGGYDFFVVRTDSIGDTLWTRAFGGVGRDIAYCVRKTAGRGYVICGRTSSYGAGGADFYLVKTNSDGDTLWTRTYGGSLNDEAFSMQVTEDGGYIVAGHTQSFGVGNYDFYVVKTDSLGEIGWTNTYGGPGREKASSVRQTHDGGYIIAGITGEDDLYLVRIAAEETSVPQGNQNEILPEKFNLYSPYPNPFNAVVRINYDVGGNGKVNVSVYNVLGERVGTVADHHASPGRYSVNWDAGDLPSGVYFIRMKAGDYQQTRKVVLLR